MTAELTNTDVLKPEKHDDYWKFLEEKSQAAFSYGFEPLWMPDFLFDFQKALTEWAIRKGRAAIFADCGLGKGNPEGAMILTPAGFVPNTALEIGDMIVASDGFAYPLKARYYRGEQDTYQVHFSDGCYFIVDSEHLHILRTNNDRQRGRPWRVVSTKQLMEMPIRYGAGGRSRNLDIPVVKPVRGVKSDHWIHPYVLGVLLGDGCITKGCTITIADRQILDTVRALLPDGWSLTQKSKQSEYDYKLSRGGSNSREFIAELRRLGVYGKRSGSKFIPLEYLFDSVDNRVWLLRGLMDTDGYIKDTSQFYSTSSRLADDVLMLIRSLGGVPTRSVKHPSCMHKGTRRIGADCHTLTFSLNTFNPFHLARKAAKWNPNPRDNGRWIDRIEPCGRKRTICLSVGSPDQSYVTENYIVTHNTPMQLVWAENVVRKTNKAVLVLTPLAVGPQTVCEGVKFGIETTRSRDGKHSGGIVITNYEKLHHFNPADFAGVVCDESSILKHFSGATQSAVTRFMLKIPYRLLCTATAAPNDYIELGTSSQALGELGYSDMLARFFKQTDNKPHRMQEIKEWRAERGRELDGNHFGKLSFRVHQSIGQWRLKGHAVEPFWRWVASWARAVRTPSDLGFDDGPFQLPELIEREHIVHPTCPPDGMLFTFPALGLREERDERRRTLDERCGLVANLVNHERPAIVWCHLNIEGDRLERAIPGSVQVSGSMSDEAKEKAYLDFRSGAIRVLITKPKLGAWGLNW